MSKATKSVSKSRSRSLSKSRSGSRSISRSKSRSRSRTRKHRYSSRSRSRSRSRSHSPPNKRERNYPREYQNNRGFRGYNRGFRRPYNFRGRGRGYYPRGRYQRGGGGGGYNNNNFRPNNWQNYRQHPLQQQQQHPQQYQQQYHQQPPKYQRGRSRTPKKRSGSPRSHSHSHHSDRSSSPRSRRSRHSSSSSHSSSPKHRSANGQANQNSKRVTEECVVSKEAQKGGAEDGGCTELTAGSGGVDEGQRDTWQGLEDNSASPKEASPLVRSAVIVGQATPTTNQSSPSPQSNNATVNEGSSWQTVAGSTSTKSPSQKSPTPVFRGFGIFSKEDDLVGDKNSLSTAFKKFLEEQNNKKQQSARENGRDMATNHVELESQAQNGSSCAMLDEPSAYGTSKGTDHYDKAERYKYKADFEGNVSLKSFLKASPFLSGNGEEEEEEEEEEVIVKSHLKSLRKERDSGDEASKPKAKVVPSARELFEEHFGRWHDLAYLQVDKDDDLDAMAEEIYHSRKQEKAAAITAALAKREIAEMLRDLSSEKHNTGSRKGKPVSKQSPSVTLRRNSEREMLMVTGEKVPPKASGKRGAEFSGRLDSLRDDLASSFDILAGERRLSRDLVHPFKKEQEFRSIFQHVQCPSELFAQHIVTIVHHIKAQHFPSSGMTLNERFAMYQRRSSEKEVPKPRKSPEIHRRIDVSPSAFMKHSHLLEGMKSSGDGSYKGEGIKVRSNSMDLRLDIERRKKHSARGSDCVQDGGGDSEDSPESSRERAAEKSGKHHKKSRKSRKKRLRSTSSSSSSSSRKADGFPHKEAETKEDVFNKGRLGPREQGGPVDRGRPGGGFQLRIRGRGWNRGNIQGNSTNCNGPLNLPMAPKNEDWDPEYTPKSRKYFLHDDRDAEREKKWLDNRGRWRGNVLRGRGRFIVRRATINPNVKRSPKWTHDKFQVNGTQADALEEDTEQGQKEEELDVDNKDSVQ